MRAIEIHQLTGPESALREVELDEPQPERGFLGGAILIDVHAAGVAFPELLQTRGLYQVKPELPFVPGSEVAGIVRSAPAESAVTAGDRAMAFCGLGGFATVAAAPEHLVFPLPQSFDMRQGAAFILNYHTAYFALVTRGKLQSGQSVLVQGAAGGLGTAALQVAKALGATTIAVVSSDAKRQVAAQAGADHVLLAGDSWKDQAREITGEGVHQVFDTVGGDRFLDSLRSLRPTGKLLVVGFAGGAIPELRVNRLLLNNIDLVGVGWGAYALPRPELCREIGARLGTMAERGQLQPIVGQSFPLTEAAAAIALLEKRQAQGKIVLDMPGA